MERKIVYHFEFEQGDSWKFPLFFTDRGHLMQSQSSSDSPWTKLEFHQCPNCPLKPDRSPLCPVAANLEPISRHSADRRSVQKVRVTVESEERTYSKSCSLQEGLRSLFGLVMATSGCPHFEWLKPLARFHLPFSDTDETLFRVLSLQLLHKYLDSPESKLAAVGGEVRAHYGELEKVNRAFIERIRAHTSADAERNALSTLDAFIQLFPFRHDENFEGLRKYFEN